MLQHLQKLVLFCLLSGTVISQTNYEVIDLGTLGGNSALAHAINDLSQVVGRSVNNSNLSRAFLWDDGIMTDLGSFTGSTSEAWDINILTQIVGVSFGEGGGAFLWDNGVMNNLGIGNSVALGINDSTQIVGASGVAGTIQAFLLNNGVITNLGTLGGDTYAYGINNNTQVVGWSHNGVSQEAFLWENGQMIGLGSISAALDINDFSQVVGSANGHAFLWENGIMQDLGALTGTGSNATSINNASQVVGYYSQAGQERACIWQNGSAYDLNTLIPSNSGWLLRQARDINNNGEIVGMGFYNNQNRAFLLRPNTFAITSPVAGEKWISGETDTIKWVGSEAGQFLDIEYSTDNGNTYSIVQLGVPAGTGEYAWSIPNTIISTKVKIKLTDAGDSLTTATSDSFRIKPYILTRIDSSTGNYYEYRKNRDQFNVVNSAPQMWPETWYNQFNYQGVDPFTYLNLNYSQTQVNGVFASSQNHNYPDWISWVNAFSPDTLYNNRLLGTYKINPTLNWQAGKTVFFGSCHGIALANALVFAHRNNFLTKFPNFTPFNNPIEVVSDNNFKKVIIELFAHQYGNPTRQNRINKWNTNPNFFLNEVREMLKEDNCKPRTAFFSNNNGGGAHVFNVYGLRKDSINSGIFYVDIYDSSIPNSNNPITINTQANGGNGTWNTPDWINLLSGLPWGGTKWIMLDIPADSSLLLPVLPSSDQSLFELDNSTIEIKNKYSYDISISDELGNKTGFINDSLVYGISDSYPLTAATGSVTPPYGYILPNSEYSISLNNFTEELVETFFFTGNKTFVFERNASASTQIDRLFFDGGVSAVNPDAETKSISLLNLINETTQEKLSVIKSMELAQNDSVKIENPDSSKVKLISYGSAKDYGVELNYVTENGIGRFENLNITLLSNTSHTFIPDWTNLTNSQLLVLVDIGNDGTIDDTLYIANTVDVKDEGNLLSPNEYNLAQNYPNPFNPATTIRYSIPQRSNVSLKVYDMLGSEVATLVNEEKPAGSYKVEFDASQLSSGVYFYRLQAGSFVETKKMILIR